MLLTLLESPEHQVMTGRYPVMCVYALQYYAFSNKLNNLLQRGKLVSFDAVKQFFTRYWFSKHSQD